MGVGANALLLDLSQGRHRIPINRCVKGVHELLGANSYLCENPFNVLIDCLETCVNACDDLVNRYRLVNVEVFIGGHGNFRHRLGSDSAPHWNDLILSSGRHARGLAAKDLLQVLFREFFLQDLSQNAIRDLLGQLLVHFALRRLNLVGCCWDV